MNVQNRAFKEALKKWFSTLPQQTFHGILWMSPSLHIKGQSRLIGHNGGGLIFDLRPNQQQNLLHQLAFIGESWNLMLPP
jgi:hypothetical protein